MGCPEGILGCPRVTQVYPGEIGGTLGYPEGMLGCPGVLQGDTGVLRGVREDVGVSRGAPGEY